MGNPVVHFEVVGKDAKSLQKFYKSAFDWRLDNPMGPVNYALAFPEAQGGINGGIGATPSESCDGHVTFYVAVPDIESALHKIEALGGKRIMGPHTVPGGPTIAQFADPESHVIGLVETTCLTA